MEIIFNKNIEPDNKAEIEKYLLLYRWLVPKYLQTLNIGIETSENPNSVATSCVSEQYREASIIFRPLWFTQTNETKKDTVVHELLHLHTNPLYDFAVNLIRKFGSGDAMQQIILDEAECYVERHTQDLAYAILSKFDGQ